MKKLLVDLDSLLDTRLGLLATLGNDLAETVVLKDDYWQREHNDWHTLTDGALTNEAFIEQWKTRTTDTLRASMMTGIVVVLSRLLAEYNRNQQEGMVNEDVQIEINIHPYTLQPEEYDELTGVIHELIYQDLVVTFCSRPLEELTPKVLNDHYAAVILYDFVPWMKHHCFNIGKQRCPGLNMIVPRLFESDPSNLTVAQKQEEVLGFRLWLLEYIDFEFIDVRWFSLLQPEKKTPA